MRIALYLCGGDMEHGRRWPGFDADAVASAGQQVDGVAVAAHDAGTRRDVIGADPVAALALKLGLGVVDQIFGLRGESDHQPRSPAPQFPVPSNDPVLLPPLPRPPPPPGLLQLLPA